jgi:hypothetical protein
VDFTVPKEIEANFHDTVFVDDLLGGGGEPTPILLEEFRALPIKPEVMEKWLWRNAQALLDKGRPSPDKS